MTNKPKENNEETQDITKMSIHEKLMNIKYELLDCDIKKSGHNDYGGFDYHELRDILPPVNRLCNKYRCLTSVDFPNSESAVLTLINVDNPEDTISTNIPRPELKVLQRMNIMQSEGSYETYLRKYLYINMFDITERDTIDALPHEEEHNNTQTKGFKKANKNKINKNKPKPSCFDSVVAKCHELYPDRECDKKLLNQVSFKMMNSNELTKKEREEFYAYLFD